MEEKSYDAGTDGPAMSGGAAEHHNAKVGYTVRDGQLEFGGPKISLMHGGGFGSDGRTEQVDPRAPAAETGKHTDSPVS